jgi:hypothetical protein
MNGSAFSRTSFLQQASPYLAIAVLLSPSLYWIAGDNQVWPWDMAWYGQVSAELWQALADSPSQWWAWMVSAFSIKAPGIAWFGQLFVPLGERLGSIEIGLLLSVILVQFGSLALTYRIAREQFSGSASLAFLGVLLTAAAPLFVAMSHEYLTESHQLFAVTYFYWIAAVSQRLRRMQTAGHLLFATALALLAKASSPIYCVIPGCIAIYDAFRRKEEPVSQPAPAEKLLLFAAIVVATATALWYAKNFTTLLEFVNIAASSDVALNYGKRDVFLNKLLYWLAAAQKSLALPELIAAIALCMLAGIIVASIHMYQRRTLPRPGRTSVLALAAASHIAAVLVLFSLNINEDPRYLLPLIPSLAIAFLWCMSFLQIQWLRISLLAAFAFQWAFVNAQALDLIAPSSRISHWVRPMRTGLEKKNEVQRLTRFTCTPQTADRYHVAGIELPWLNANSLSFYMAKERLSSKVRCYYVSLGYAQKDVAKALARIDSLNISHYISLDAPAHPVPPDFVNQVSIPVLQKVQHDERFVQERFESRLGIVVFRKVK